MKTLILLHECLTPGPSRFCLFFFLSSRHCCFFFLLFFCYLLLLSVCAWGQLMCCACACWTSASAYTPEGLLDSQSFAATSAVPLHVSPSSPPLSHSSYLQREHKHVWFNSNVVMAKPVHSIIPNNYYQKTTHELEHMSHLPFTKSFINLTFLNKKSY